MKKIIAETKDEDGFWLVTCPKMNRAEIECLWPEKREEE